MTIRDFRNLAKLHAGYALDYQANGRLKSAVYHAKLAELAVKAVTGDEYDMQLASRAFR